MRTIRDTLVLVAEDCPVTEAEAPPLRDGPKSLARLHYEFLSAAPYALTLDDLDWAIHLARSDVSEAERDGARAALLSKGRPCMRASPLCKRYGWGAHYDSEGRIAIVAVESDRYRALLADPGGLSVTRAMRTKRA